MEPQDSPLKKLALEQLGMHHVAEQGTRGVGILFRLREDGDAPSDTTRLLATSFCQSEDGWRLFCTRLDVQSDDVLEKLPGAAFSLARVEALARPLQLYVGPASESYMRFGLSKEDYPTAERICAGYRALYDRLIGAAS